MKVELKGSLGKAMLKGCLWMGESKSSTEEGEEDEANQQPKLPQQRCSTAKTCDEEGFSRSHYL